jgi:hypothetical protein
VYICFTLTVIKMVILWLFNSFYFGFVDVFTPFLLVISVTLLFIAASTAILLCCLTPSHFILALRAFLLYVPQNTSAGISYIIISSSLSFCLHHLGFSHCQSLLFSFCYPLRLFVKLALFFKCVIFVCVDIVTTGHVSSVRKV